MVTHAGQGKISSILINMMNIWLPLLLPVIAAVGGMILIWILKKPVRGVYLATLLLPVLQTVDLPVVAKQLTIIEPIVLITAMAWFFRLVVTRQKLHNFNAFYIPIVFFLLSCTLSLLNTRSMRLSLLELGIYVYLFGLFAVVTQLIRTEGQLRIIERMWVLSMLLVVVLGWVGIWQQTTGIEGLFVSRSLRVTSTLRATNQLPSFLIMPFPLVLSYVVDREQPLHMRLGALILTLAALPVMLATGSRAAIVLLVAGGFVFLVWKGFNLRFLLVCSLVAVVILSVSLTVSGGKGPQKSQRALSLISLTLEEEPSRAEQKFETYMGKIGEYRDPSGAMKLLAVLSPPRYVMILVWQQALHEHPLTGIGVGDLHNYFLTVFPDARPWEMHNTYLGVWAEEGILGITTLLVVLFLIGREAVFVILRVRNPYLRHIGGALALAILLSLIYGLTHFGLRHRHLWMAMAQLVAIGAIARKKVASGINPAYPVDTNPEHQGDVA